jgi:hypothetical protein
LGDTSEEESPVLTDDSELLSKIQDVFFEIQRTVGEAGGMIRQFILDDKGDFDMIELYQDASFFCLCFAAEPQR